MFFINVPIDGNFLKEKTKIFAEKMNIDFKAFNCLFERFKKQTYSNSQKTLGRKSLGRF